jgi:porphobilinogen synthase
MDPANGDEALEEIHADIEQGADSIIIKPALSYLDVIARAKQKFTQPIIAYNVSGEYRMLHDAVASGYSRPEIIDETLLSMKRAGADRIITYFTPAMLGSIVSTIAG